MRWLLAVGICVVLAAVMVYGCLAVASDEERQLELDQAGPATW